MVKMSPVLLAARGGLDRGRRQTEGVGVVDGADDAAPIKVAEDGVDVFYTVAESLRGGR